MAQPPAAAARQCFVIMPFSATKQCTEPQWTRIFTDLIQPAVEGDPGLGYVCRRSNALRGNFIKGIVEDLRDAHVVIADLTDRNPNVFYELGVRHTLTDRTILIAQSRADIPSDLQSYANHVYGWRTDRQKEAFTKRIRELMRDVDAQPDRPDNPVSDFLGVRRANPTGQAGSETEQRLRFLEEQQLVLSRQVASVSRAASGVEADRQVDDWIDDPENPAVPPAGYSMRRVAQRLAKTENKIAARSLARRLRRQIAVEVEAKVSELNRREGGQLNQNEILPRATQFLGATLPIVAPLEEFALACVEAGVTEAVTECLAAAGDLFSVEERSHGGLRFAVGLPGFLGLRLLLFMGSKAIADDDYDTAGMVLREPIQVLLTGGQASAEPLWKQRQRFWPEAFLGFADLPMRHFDATWGESPHLLGLFVSEEAFREALVLFMFLISLLHAGTTQRELYPGYRLIKDAGVTLNAFAARLKTSGPFRQKVAMALGETEEEFIRRWPERAAVLNEAKLGGNYYFRHGNELPLSLS